MTPERAEPWIALLRGINVGGHRKLPMKDLRKHLEDLGCRSVQTYIQSGNAVYRSPRDVATALADRIEARHHFRAKVLTLRARSFRDALEANPFAEATGDPKSLHLFFLEGPPRDDAAERLAEVASPEERFVLTRSVLYLHSPAYLTGSRIAPVAERLLGTEATARNWRTVERILALVDQV